MNDTEPQDGSSAPGPPLPGDLAAALADPEFTVTVTDPKGPGDGPDEEDPGPGLRWFDPRLWVFAMIAWVDNWRLPYWMSGHRHFYRLIAACYVPAGFAAVVAGAGATAGGVTVLVFRCTCHGADQLRHQVMPGKFGLDDVTAVEWPALISVARAQYLGELAAVRKMYGDGEAATLLEPVEPDWQHVAREMADAQRNGPEAWADAKRLYLHAVRIQAEADAQRASPAAAAGRVHVAQPDGF